ncbi:hypothetical protein GCM10023165_30800 [Variovorax defluvii]|uniref:Uncharacterized protein n=1 Tax=Variovorax defluvii TaxID=913761 RepID=A0ABP8HWP2_9BURK
MDLVVKDTRSRCCVKLTMEAIVAGDRIMALLSGYKGLRRGGVEQRSQCLTTGAAQYSLMVKDELFPAADGAHMGLLDPVRTSRVHERDDIGQD